MSTSTERESGWLSSAGPVSALALLLTTLSLSSLLSGVSWLLHALVAIMVITGVGVGLRSLRWHPALVVLGQFSTLIGLLTAMFSTHAFLIVIPSGATAGDFAALASGAAEQIREAVPPVSPPSGMLFVITAGIGLVAVLVDTLAVTASAPAACGLVLLALYAIPASLSESLLPWWAFLLAATGFGLLLTAQRTDDSGGLRTNGLGPAALTVGGTAAVIALLAGSSLTGVGTEGRLPGELGGSQIGYDIDPMVSLRGQLDKKTQSELFRVRNLPDREGLYMRAVTLRKFTPNKGWSPEGLMAEQVDSTVLRQPDVERRPPGTLSTVSIEFVGAKTNWLPTFGLPLGLPNPQPGWNYDPEATVLVADQKLSGISYQEHVLLPQPSLEDLRAANGPSTVDPAYTQRPEVDPRIAQLARDITKDKTTTYDKARAITDYLRDRGRFTYSLDGPGKDTGDALADFLFTSRKGYCQQFAAAMGVLARLSGMPARVAVGYTVGFNSGEYRSITTGDPHAWVEVWFPGLGWQTFDPTPLTDQRVTPPAYQSDRTPSASPTTTAVPSPTASTATPTRPGSPDGSKDDAQNGGVTPTAQQQPNWPLGVPVLLLVVLLVALVVLSVVSVRTTRDPVVRRTRTAWGSVSALAAIGGVAVLAVFAALPWWVWVAAIAGMAFIAALVPMVARSVVRRRRLRQVAAGGDGAAIAAWRELRAESIDRGVAIHEADTVRGAARRMVKHHDIDEPGREGIRVLITAVERQWYSPTPPDSAELAASLHAVLASLRSRDPLSFRQRLWPRSVLVAPPSYDEAALEEPALDGEFSTV
ncbi:transglutaminase domain-containing protein [Pseudonocardiaceae bacterium YIM PH 21723]|nr:transglutaminase domain-containing protein [Pseudonocardiaceae bacterium YIM PH 21723]